MAKVRDFFTTNEYKLFSACNADGSVYGWLLFNGASYLETAKGQTRVFKTSDAAIGLCEEYGAINVMVVIVEGC